MARPLAEITPHPSPTKYLPIPSSLKFKHISIDNQYIRPTFLFTILLVLLALWGSIVNPTGLREPANGRAERPECYTHIRGFDTHPWQVLLEAAAAGVLGGITKLNIQSDN